MEVLSFNRQLRCCNVCLAREVVPGHDTNLILFVVSAFMYFPFFPETPFFIQVMETQPVNSQTSHIFTISNQQQNALY